MADFEEHRERLDELGVEVLAFSVDSEEEATETADRLGLGFLVGFGADLEEVVEKTGAYADRRRGHLQPASFVLRGDRIAHVTYSSGPLGRLRAEKVVGLVEYETRDE